MKILKNFLNPHSFTEKVFIFAVFALILTLSFSVIAGKRGLSSFVFADEESNGIQSESQDDADEQEDEQSVDDEDELSTPSVASTPSEESVLEGEEVSTPSTVSTEQEVSISEDEELSVQNENFPSVSDFETVAELEDNVLIVSNKERLFFLIPVDIKQTLTLDEEGKVIGVKQTLLSRILSWLSF